MDKSKIFQELIARFSGPQQNPDKLFHYTTATGLIGILTTKSLYATHLEFMNDMHELQYGKELIGHQIEQYAASKDKLVQDMFGYVKREILDWKAYDSFSPDDFFAVCFCEEGDILSQWRAYSASGGFSIGWDTFALQHAAGAMNGHLLQVMYDQDEQMRIIAGACSEVEGLILKFRNELIEASESKQPPRRGGGTPTFHDHLVSMFYTFALRFKRPAFKEEREWRLVFHEPLLSHIQPNPNALDVIQFRERKGHISPYYNFDLRPAFEDALDNTDLVPFPIREIAIGPSSDADMNAKAVKALLGRMTSRGHLYVDISKSNIPLRW